MRVENNKSDDKEGRHRQSFPEFVPDQFIVLYGVKSLAIKNINEFLCATAAANQTRKAWVIRRIL